jgi:predicted RND superfamily exporter protein
VADRITRMFARLARLRWVIFGLYAAAVPVAAWVATQIPREGAIDRLIVPSDPDYVATREFQKIFPEPKLVLLVFQSADPWSPEALARVDRSVQTLALVPHVQPFSPIDAIRRTHPGATPDELRSLATGTNFFHRQGLIGDDFITVIANLDVSTPHDRDVALAGIHLVLLGQPVHEVGGPVVASWLEQESSAATGKAFIAFGVLLVLVTLFLYRSFRALLAFAIALGASVALAVAAGALCGFSFTIVSVLVPLSVMVSTLATLTYIHLRFIDHPEGVPIVEHQAIALRNKILPVTASTLAAAMGFAALAVSSIRPIREMGLWTALGMLIAWVVAFTLFPALQLILHTPTGRRVRVRTAIYNRISQAIPRWTYRYRRPLVGAALAACTAGALAVAGMPVQVDVLSNIDPGSKLYRDLKWFRDHVMSLDMVRIWIHLPHPTATEPEVLRGLDRFASALEATPGITGVAGPTTMFRLRSYFAGHGAQLPADAEGFATAVSDIEQLLLTEPGLRTFIDPSGLADLQITVLFHDGNAPGYAVIEQRIHTVWNIITAASPGLAGAQMSVVGEALLQVKVGASLVPTLAESLLITVGFILIVFLIVTRSPIERLLAMIPSAFALLVTFLGLRLFGGALNIATIIIATTVLGTTENDQLHLFHHMHEVSDQPLEDRLHHTLRVAGRAIVFATFIYAAGFLALATSTFPPLRQFGIMTSAAFVLAMIADFALLPAALWLATRAHPRSVDDNREPE